MFIEFNWVMYIYLC